jgi:hypothetical protein
LAIYTVATERDDLDVDSVLGLLRDAVTDWVRETDEGRTAWEDSEEDFNIGDFDDLGEAESFRPFMRRHGIVRIMRLYLGDMLDAFPYDTVLPRLGRGED